MKVLLDANVLLSYLLKPASGSASAAVVGRVLSRVDLLVLPDEVVNESVRIVSTKPFFTQRVTIAGTQLLIDILRRISIQSPPLTTRHRQWTRDAKDDYLVAAALAAGVDYLISGDKDLLVLGDALAPLKIRSPQAFLDELEGTNPAVVD
jgi:putative PIN family toxin of toxin-antitoxin system